MSRSTRSWLNPYHRLGIAALTALSLLPWACKREDSGQSQAPDMQVDRLDDESLARVVGRPGMNVLFISVDTTRADHLGCYGHPIARTPNIDKFASEGARFSQCISSAPLTLVSHSTMMTGSYQFVHGARDNTTFKLAPENVTLAEIFKEAGYATHAEVATVILDEKFGLSQGFDTYTGVPETPATIMDAGSEEFGVTIEGLGQLLTDRLAVDIVDHAGRHLERLKSQQKPFFMFLHFYDPHWPHEAPEEFAKQYTDAYVAEIAYFDSQFGRLMGEIDRLKLAETTLVVLCSDHGEGKGEHGESTHSAFIYDSTLHVPLIMRCKGVIPAGIVVPPQVRLVDLAPTVLEFVGLGDKKTPQMQGTSLLPLIVNPELRPGLECYADTICPQMMFGYSPLRALRTDEFKYIHAPLPELYDIQKDAQEIFNIAVSEEGRTQAMRQGLYDLIATSPAPPGSRASVHATDEKTLEKLRALGYISSDDSLDEMTHGSELDQFEPVGPNPRDHMEEIELLTGTMGAVRMGEYEKAEAGLRRLVDLTPDHKLAVATLASALLGQKKLEEAEHWYRRAIELDPGSCTLKKQLGVLYYQLVRFADCEKALRDAIECDPAEANTWGLLGACLFAQGRMADSLKAMDEFVKMKPDAALALCQRALVRARAGDTTAALADLDQAIKLEPELPRAHASKAAILQESGKQAEAIAYLKERIELQPSEPLFRNQLARIYIAMKDLDAAGAELARVVEIDPKSSEGRIAFAANLVLRGKKEEGIDQLRKAIEVDPASRAAHDHLATMLAQDGKLQELRELYSVILTKWPRPDLFVKAANLATQSGDEADAVHTLQEAVQKFPEDATINNDLAWRLATCADDKIRDGKRAVELARRATGLTEGDNPMFLDTLAAAYAETGEFGEALAIAGRAKALALEFKAPQVADEIAARIEYYKENKPYRDKPVDQP